MRRPSEVYYVQQETTNHVNPVKAAFSNWKNVSECNVHNSGMSRLHTPGCKSQCNQCLAMFPLLLDPESSFLGQDVSYLHI